LTWAELFLGILEDQIQKEWQHQGNILKHLN
jgi:hypothetical protein